MLNHDIEKASTRVASALHVETKLFLATTEEFLWATLGHLTIFSSWYSIQTKSPSMAPAQIEKPAQQATELPSLQETQT